METSPDYQSLASLFRVLSNPVRIQILALLVKSPLCVSDLVVCTSKRQAYISQQLMYLRSIGWVKARKDGWSVCYYLVDQPNIQKVKFIIDELCPNYD